MYEGGTGVGTGTGKGADLVEEGKSEVGRTSAPENKTELGREEIGWEVPLVKRPCPRSRFINGAVREGVDSTDERRRGVEVSTS